MILEVLEGPMDGLICTIEDLKISIGRNPGNTLTLPWDKTISRKHAQILYEGPVLCIKDLGSLSGTWVNGQKVTPNESLEININDKILVGGTLIGIFDDDLPFQSISINQALNDITLDFDFSDDIKQIFQHSAMINDDCSYIDVNKLLIKLTEQLTCLNDFSSISDLKNNNHYQDAWIKNGVTCSHKIPEDMPVHAPRLWRIADIADKSKKDHFIDSEDLLIAIVEEKRSLIVKTLLEDSSFIEYIKTLGVDTPCSDQTFITTETENKESLESHIEKHILLLRGIAKDIGWFDNILDLVCESDHECSQKLVRASETVSKIFTAYDQCIDRLTQKLIQVLVDEVNLLKSDYTKKKETELINVIIQKVNDVHNRQNREKWASDILKSILNQ
jgi:hypothetical protein